MSTLKIFGGTSHPALTSLVCDNLGVVAGKSEVIRFSNENMMVKIHEHVREADVFVLQTSCPPVSDNILELLITIDALKHASAKRITAVMPYFPYSRSDKKDQPRISIAARLMADLIESAGADRVLTMDLHSPQVQGFFRIPADQLKAINLLCPFLSERDLSNYILVAGDSGEAKDVGKFASILDLPMAIIDKRRYGNDEKPKCANLIGSVRGKVAMIIDDEIATGRTILDAARFLAENGATEVRACCVHPVLSGEAARKLNESAICELIVTDTIPIPPEKVISKIKTISIARQIVGAIKCIHYGESVSSLFKY